MPVVRTVDPVASISLQSYEHQQLLHRARKYIYIKGAVNMVIALLFLLTFPPELRPGMVAIALADALLLVPYWFLVQRYPTLATCLSLGITSLAISAGDWVGGYQTGASGILYALLIVGGHLVLIKPLSTYLLAGLTTAIYVGTITLEVNDVIPINFPFTSSNLLRVVSLSVICMFGLTILTGVVTRLYRELLQRNKELFALNAVSAATSQSLNLDKVLQMALDKVLEVMELEGGGLYLLEAGTGEMTLEAHRNLAEESIEWVSRIKGEIEGFTDSPSGTGQVLVVDDPSQHPMVSETAGDGNGHRPLAIVSLKVKDRVLGRMNLLGRIGYSFTPQDVELLNTIGAQVGMAIERAQLYEREQKRTVQLAVVNKVGHRATSILDMDQLLQEAVVAIQQGFNYYNVTLSLLDETANELEVRAIAGGFTGLVPPGYRQAVRVGIVGWVAQTGQSLLANDVNQEPRYILGFLEKPLTKSELCVPLKLADQVIGVLDVQSTQLNAFDETDLLAMEILADQIAIAIKNAQLFRETRRHLEGMTALYQTSLDFTAQLEMRELLKSIVERAVTLLLAESGGIFLYDPEREELRGAIGCNDIARYVGVILKPGEGIAGRVFQTGEPLIVDNYRTWEGAPVIEADQPFTAVLEVPLKWQERVVGVLVIADVRERTFNQDDLWLATLFASQAAVAIENARLHQEVRHRAEELTFLNRVGRAATSSLDLKQVLMTIMEETALVLKTEACSILLLDEKSSELIFEAAGGPRSEEVKGRRLLLGQGIAGWVARQGQPLLVPDVGDDPRFYSGIDEATGFATKSVLAVPLEARGQVIGVIEAVNKTEGDVSQADVALLSSMAQWAAIAIENARLYQQTDEKLQTRVRELSALYVIAEMMNYSLDLDQVLQLALDSAIRLTGMESGGILLLNPSTNEMLLKAHRGWSPEFIRAVSRTKADDGLMPHLLKSALVVDDLSRLTKERRAAIEREGFRSVVSIPLRSEERTLGVMGVTSRSPRTFASEELELLTAIGNQVGLAVDRANLQAQELRAAILEERQYMAQQMHDDIAQTLGYLGLRIDAVMGNSSLAQNEEAQADLEDIRRAIEDAYEHVRNSIIRLREDVPGHFDLRAALPEIISEFEKQTGCRVESRVDEGQLPRLSPSVAFQATYIIREALTNVRKHSGADSVHLTLQDLEDGRIEVIIQDNGRGFDLDGERQSGWKGFGLRFMRERAERAGGNLRVESTPGQGTRVVVSLRQTKGG